MFHAGDEKYSGDWLTKFQRTDGAWQVCVDCLNAGPPASCDSELLQEFCAQTLARWSRTFIRYHVEELRPIARDTLEGLLVMHVGSPSCIWRQLALALVSADLWMGNWSARMAAIPGLPDKVQLELLILPTELLFCERALPLNDRFLQQAAGRALYEACEAVFPALLSSPAIAMRAGQPMTASAVSGSRLQCLAAWLCAIRKSMRLLPGCDEAVPLRCLMAKLPDLLGLAADDPAEACDVAVQIARWKGCPSDLAPLLQPLLEKCFLAADTPRFKALIPLLSEMAEYCWPSAALGEMDVDWQAMAQQSLKLRSLPNADDDDDSHSADTEEGILSAWQTFADSIVEASGESRNGSKMSRLRVDSSAPPPEKKSRVLEVWRVPQEQVAKAVSLQQLFRLLLLHITGCLQFSEFTLSDHLDNTQSLRAVAETVIQSWMALANLAASWKDVLLVPFHNLRELLKQCVSQGYEVPSAIVYGPSFGDTEVWHELEVILWLATTLLTYWPDSTREELSCAALVMELDACNAAPAHLRALLWASTARLAAAASLDQLPQMLAWVLRRPPAPAVLESGFMELLEVTELPYAEAVELICRRLLENGYAWDPQDRREVGERLFALAFSTYTSQPLDVELPEEILEAQAKLLQAMRHVMGSDPTALCETLASKVLPQLAQAAEAEAARAQSSKGEKPWRDTLLLYATLRALLPAKSSSEESHPSAVVWRQFWRYFECGLMHWPQNAATEQPASAAIEALVAGVSSLPCLLSEALRLVNSMSVSMHLQLKLHALQEIAAKLPCPPCSPSVAAGMLTQSLAQAIASVSLTYQHNLGLGVQQLTSPAECEEAFRLLAEALRPPSADLVGASPCQDMLRSHVLAEGSIVTRGLEMANEALPGCTSTSCAKAVLRFILHAVDADVEAHTVQHRQTLASALAPTCGAICKGLSLQEHMAEPELVAIVAEILEKAGRAFPAELPLALQSGLCEVQVPDQSRSQFWQHVANRSCWAQQQEWQEHLQQIVCDWQRHQHVICT